MGLRSWYQYLSRLECMQFVQLTAVFLPVFLSGQKNQLLSLVSLVITGNFVCSSHWGCVKPRDRNSDVDAGTRGFGSAEPGQALALPLRG